MKNLDIVKGDISAIIGEEIAHLDFKAKDNKAKNDPSGFYFQETNPGTGVNVSCSFLSNGAKRRSWGGFQESRSPKAIFKE